MLSLPFLFFCISLFLLLGPNSEGLDLVPGNVFAPKATILGEPVAGIDVLLGR